MSNKIAFKYHPNVYDNDIIAKEAGICQCCGEKVSVYCTTMYCKTDINCICMKCVSSGDAADMYNGTFIQDAEVAKVDSSKKTDELFKRTPGYVSWQGEFWLACCNDYCCFIGDVGTEELEEMGIANEVFEEYDSLNEYENARDYLKKEGSLAGYLFRCLQCGKYHLWVDAD